MLGSPPRLPHNPLGHDQMRNALIVKGIRWVVYLTTSELAGLSTCVLVVERMQFRLTRSQPRRCLACSLLRSWVQLLYQSSISKSAFCMWVVSENILLAEVCVS